MKIVKNPLCIAISGRSGCGNTSISSMLSQTLGITLINYTFRSVAKEKTIPLEEVCRLAENDTSWDKYVDDKQKELSLKQSCVVGSRLAIWMLGHADIKIYLYADEQERAARIQKREGGLVKERLAQTHRRDERDAVRYQNLYNIDISRYREVADLVINTNGKNKQPIIEEITHALQARGLVE